MAGADLLLHPVRLRVLRAFLGERALTTAQLAAELEDVPAGSLYRHVALLTKAGVLEVVAERRVRGAVERTYTPRVFAGLIDAGAVAAMSADEHARAFLVFVAGLLADFEHYLAAGPPDLAGDGLSYRGAPLWLSDAEYAEFLGEVAALLQPRLANAPGAGRRRRMVYSVLLPA